MNNYEAIMKMNREQLETFLDCIYCTGLNNGMFYSRQPEGQAEEILDENPFDMKWLKSDAEPATLCVESEDGDDYLLEAYAQAVLRNAGIGDDETITELDVEKNINVVIRNEKKD